MYGLAAQAVAAAGGGRLAELGVRFLRAAAGRRLRARARVVHAGREVAVVQCELCADEGPLAATALGSLSRR